MLSAPACVKVVTRETVPPCSSPATTDEPAISLTNVQPLETSATIPQSTNRRGGRIGIPCRTLLTLASAKKLNLPTPRMAPTTHGSMTKC